VDIEKLKEKYDLQFEKVITMEAEVIEGCLVRTPTTATLSSK
jgi:hypothetical protein